MPEVNPEILVWARETAGLSLESAAKAVELKTAYGMSGSERLTLLESGKETPSRTILSRMAKKYRRPLVIFYLSEIPRKGDRGQDFRTFPDIADPVYDPLLDSLIRNILARQRLVKSLLEDEDGDELAFIGSASNRDNAVNIASEIISRMGFDRATYRKRRSPEDAFSYLRQCMEDLGVFVLLIGDLGSHHSAIPAAVFRGYAISDKLAPLVVVNDQDVKIAWPFTALHELAHLWLGTTGVSGASYGTGVEVLCNNVASEILLPSEEIYDIGVIPTTLQTLTLETISRFAGERNLSRSMVAYRCFKAGLIDEHTWRDLTDRMERDRLDAQAKRKKSDTGDTGGGDYYVTRRHRLGPSLLQLVRHYINEGSLTPTKAGTILGVKPRNVAPLLSGLSQGGGG